VVDLAIRFAADGSRTMRRFRAHQRVQVPPGTMQRACSGLRARRRKPAMQALHLVLLSVPVLALRDLPCVNRCTLVVSRRPAWVVFRS